MTTYISGSGIQYVDGSTQGTAVQAQNVINYSGTVTWGAWTYFDFSNDRDLIVQGAHYYWTVGWGYSYSYYHGRTAVFSGTTGLRQAPPAWYSQNGSTGYLQTEAGIFGSYGEYVGVYFRNDGYNGQKYISVFPQTIGGLSPSFPTAGGTMYVTLWRITNWPIF